MTVEITVTDKVRAWTPYSVQFVSEARKLGGKFQKNDQGKYWVFDMRDEDAVNDFKSQIDKIRKMTNKKNAQKELKKLLGGI